MLAIAAVAVFAWLSFGSGRAEAACGDYVFVRGILPHATGETMSESHRSPDVALNESVAEPRQPPTRLPCRGPSCSNEPAAPAAPAPTTEWSHEQWACVVARGFACDVGRGLSAPSSDADLPEGRPLGILRPPR